MNRHGYGAGANGHYSSGRNFNISTDKYDKYVPQFGMRQVFGMRPWAFVSLLVWNGRR